MNAKGGDLWKMKSWTEAFIPLPLFVVSPLTWTWERRRWQANCQRSLRCKLWCIKRSESHLISDFWHMDNNLWFPPLSRYQHIIWLSRSRRRQLHFHNPKLKMKSRATFWHSFLFPASQIAHIVVSALQVLNCFNSNVSGSASNDCRWEEATCVAAKVYSTTEQIAAKDRKLYQWKRRLPREIRERREKLSP